MEEMNQVSIGEPEFLDLKRPWLYSPGRAGKAQHCG